jgi:hypothetical protein
MSNELSPAERIEALFKIANFHLERLKARQVLEFRLSFGLWAVLIASLIYVDRATTPLVRALLLFLLLFHAVWVFPINWRNYHEVTRAYFYRDATETIARGEEVDLGDAPKGWDESSVRHQRKIRKQVFSSTLVWFQIGVTFLLVMANIFLPGADLIRRD